MDWRWLQEEATPSPTPSPTTEAEAIEGRDAEVLRNTMRIYGGLFFIMSLIFSYVRRKYPGVYNLRSHVEDLKTHLADEQFGFLSWLWKLYFISDVEFLEECGMDSLCFVRVLEFGFKLSVLGMFNAIWLIPVYATSDEDAETALIEDRIQSISIAHVPSGSYRALATVVAAYSIFGFTMYNILKEFEWFIRQRHTFLSKPYARNYAVYVQNVPQEYLNDAKFLEFFTQASSKEDILEVQLSRNIPNLAKLVAKREALIASLEHSINIEEITGNTPMTLTLIGESRNAIHVGYEELAILNTEITAAIETIELLQNDKPADTFASETSAEASLVSSTRPTSVDALGRSSSIISKPIPAEINADGRTEDQANATDETKKTNLTDTLFKSTKSLTKNVTSVVPTQQFAAVAGAAAGGLGAAAGAAAKFLNGEEDGAPFTSGFVTFTSLRATQAALQMIQYPEPFAMEVLEAPEPEDIFWQNVGKTHKELQLGKLLSFGLTAALCLFWTIPMVTINALSSIEGLRTVGFIDSLLHVVPWLEPVFAQLAPLLIVVARLVLKVVLERLSMFEGPISGAVVQASLFMKLAAFMLIQTFFVSAISGGLTSELSRMLDNPSSIIEVLAVSLPGQSTFHTQVLLVDTFLPLGLELLRVVPLAIAAARRIVGPNLTEKERNTPYFGLNPITCPDEFGHADVLSGSVLYFMVLFVYSSLAPITCFFLGFCFLLMGACYRHQIIYIYPTVPDSGGKLWVKFISLLPMMMIFAEVTLLGLMTLKQAFVASSLMIPLIVATVLFNIYIQQQHFKMTEHLPTRTAIRQDQKNARDELDMSFLKGLYRQPELREKELFPENSTVDREMAQGAREYGTPQNSVVDEKEEFPGDLSSFSYTPASMKV